jgi:hypothetical protein
MDVIVNLKSHAIVPLPPSGPKAGPNQERSEVVPPRSPCFSVVTMEFFLMEPENELADFTRFLTMSSTATLMEDSMSSATLSALGDSISPSESSIHCESSSASESPEESKVSKVVDFDPSNSMGQVSAMDEVDNHLQDQSAKLVASDHDRSDDEDLSPERMDEILIRAAARLREQRNLLQPISPAHKSLPTLDSRGLPVPYMRSTKGVVRLEPKSLISEKQRRLGDNARSVEDTVSLQARAKSKGLSAQNLLPTPFSRMMKSTNFSLKWLSFSYWVSLHINESYTFIVTLNLDLIP